MQLESQDGGGSPAPAALPSADGAGSAISGILSRTAGDRLAASRSDSGISFLVRPPADRLARVYCPWSFDACCGCLGIHITAVRPCCCLP